MKQQKNVQFLATAGIIAALYCALTLLLPFMTFGPIQCRFSEALTILPVFTPAAIPGLIVGCVLSNTFGLAMGANVAGAWDILFGTLATALAALLTKWLGSVRIKGFPVLSTLPPIVLNGLIIGTELTFALYTDFSFGILLFNIATVSAGQLVACTGGGLLLFAAVRRTNLFERL